MWELDQAENFLIFLNMFLKWMILFVFMVLIFYTIAFLRKPPKKKKNILSFHSEKRAKEIMRAIVRYAIENGFIIDDFSEGFDKIVISDKPSLTTFGNFYPIFLSETGDSGTLVEVGVSAKATITGTASFRYRDRVINALKAVILTD